MDTTKVTRVEVIDTNGRAYVHWGKNSIVEIQLQDEGRTIKIFISKRNNDNNNRGQELTDTSENLT